MDKQDFNNFVELAPTVIPNLWKHMCNLRNLKGDYHTKDKDRMEGKKRQVLLQIFALKRMRNQRSLKWWSLVQAVAYYGWGVGRTALDATHKWGLTCSSRTRDRCLSILTNKLIQRQTRYFSAEDAIMFCMDNYQVG